jgi:dTDP-glucose 4,6-dehydratase
MVTHLAINHCSAWRRTVILTTGGAGFIGANFVLQYLAVGSDAVVNLDKLTYAGNVENLASLRGNSSHIFVHGDIANRPLVRQLLKTYRPSSIVNFAAESHVDRSIHSPDEFIQTNVVGTFHLLDEARVYWQELSPDEKLRFRFLHVSTDEVYGSLGRSQPAFSETTPYAPNSPYAASKAASDHLVRAYHHTYGLPTLITNCSNNYGPYQFPEKLIPLMIQNALAGKPLPVYGDGSNVRDWVYVTDHCTGVRRVLQSGQPGESYNIGGRSERANIDVVRMICLLLDELHPQSPVTPHGKLITFVKDRPGHDQRYAIDCTKMETRLGWRPTETFESGLRKTIAWYLQNQSWIAGVTSREYGNWVELNYADR